MRKRYLGVASLCAASFHRIGPRLLSLFGVLALSLVWMVPVRPGLAAASRNILLIVADDVGIDATDLYPVPPNIVTTPAPAPVSNLRVLASRGVLFDNAWGSPACSMARAEIFTGRNGFRTGVGTAIASPSNPQVKLSEFSLPEAFKASTIGRRYYLAHIGKWHISTNEADPNLQGWNYFAGFMKGQLPGYWNWPKTVNGVTGTSSVYNTTDLTNEAIAAIGRAKQAGKPWLVWLAYAAGHYPWRRPPNELHSYDSIPFSCWPECRLQYRAMIEAMDTEIGRLLKSVDLSTTTVIFTSDNGTPAEVIATSPSGLHAKWSIYEGGVRVPLLVAGAGVSAPGRRDVRLAQAADLYPTILSLAGIDWRNVVPSGVKLDGRSLMPIIARTSSDPVRTYAYSENFNSVWNANFQRTIRDARFALIEREGGPTPTVPANAPRREFYDLRNDPLQQRNLLTRTLTSYQRSRLEWLDTQLDQLLATR